MSALRKKEEKKRKDLNPEDLVNKSEVRGFVRIAEDLEIRLQRVTDNLKEKEAAYADLLNACGPFGWVKKCFRSGEAKKDLEEAQRRKKYISEASDLFKLIMAKINGDECCCAQDLSDLLQSFVTHMKSNEELFEDVSDCSLSFVIKKARRLRDFVNEIASLNPDMLNFA